VGSEWIVSGWVGDTYTHTHNQPDDDESAKPSDFLFFDNDESAKPSDFLFVG